MNEMEISYWGCLNDKTQYNSWRENDQKSIMNRLLMTAYVSKKNIAAEDTSRCCEAFFRHNYSGFLNKFSDWSLMEDFDDKKVTVQAVNKKFVAFNKYYTDANNKELVDYNYEVDMLDEEHRKKDQVNTRFVYEPTEKTVSVTDAVS
jgi:hypothetical protein